MGAGLSNDTPGAQTSTLASGVPDELDWGQLFTSLFRPEHRATLVVTHDTVQLSVGAGKVPCKVVQSYSLNDGELVVQQFQPSAVRGFVGIVSQVGEKDTPNQDSAFFLEFTDRDGSRAWMGCVMDGHGPSGHHMSRLSMQWLPLLVLRDAAMTSDRGFLVPRQHQSVFDAVASALAKLGVIMSRASQEGLQMQLSGTTCVFAICARGVVHTANVGDSRAVLGSIVFPSDDDQASSPDDDDSALAAAAAPAADGDDADGDDADSSLREGPSSLSGAQTPRSDQEGPAGWDTAASEKGELDVTCLTRDHKPEDAEERLRIEAHGGVIDRRRVWMTTWPFVGLNMSRSLGDHLAHTVGVSPEADVAATFMDASRHQFVLLASDGVWDVLSNQHASSLVAMSLHQAEQAVAKGEETARAGASQRAALSLARASTAQWHARHRHCDDITVLLVRT